MNISKKLKTNDQKQPLSELEEVIQIINTQSYINHKYKYEQIKTYLFKQLPSLQYMTTTVYGENHKNDAKIFENKVFDGFLKDLVIKKIEGYDFIDINIQDSAYFVMDGSMIQWEEKNEETLKKQSQLFNKYNNLEKKSIFLEIDEEKQSNFQKQMSEIYENQQLQSLKKKMLKVSNSEYSILLDKTKNSIKNFNTDGVPLYNYVKKLERDSIIYYDYYKLLEKQYEKVKTLYQCNKQVILFIIPQDQYGYIFRHFTQKSNFVIQQFQKIFDEISQESLKKLGLIAQECIIDKNEIIYKQGDISNYVYVVKQGEVEITVKKMQTMRFNTISLSKYVTVKKLQGYNILGLHEMNETNSKRIMQITTLGKVQCYKIPNKTLEQIVNDSNNNIFKNEFIEYVEKIRQEFFQLAEIKQEQEKDLISQPSPLKFRNFKSEKVIDSNGNLFEEKISLSALKQATMKQMFQQQNIMDNSSISPLKKYNKNKKLIGFKTQQSILNQPNAIDRQNIDLSNNDKKEEKSIKNKQLFKRIKDKIRENNKELFLGVDSKNQEFLGLQKNKMGKSHQRHQSTIDLNRSSLLQDKTKEIILQNLQNKKKNMERMQRHSQSIDTLKNIKKNNPIMAQVMSQQEFESSHYYQKTSVYNGRKKKFSYDFDEQFSISPQQKQYSPKKSGNNLDISEIQEFQDQSQSYHKKSESIISSSNANTNTNKNSNLNNNLLNQYLNEDDENDLYQLNTRNTTTNQQSPDNKYQSYVSQSNKLKNGRLILPNIVKNTHLTVKTNFLDSLKDSQKGKQMQNQNKNQYYNENQQLYQMQQDQLSSQRSFKSRQESFLDSKKKHKKSLSSQNLNYLNYMNNNISGAQSHGKKLKLKQKRIRTETSMNENDNNVDNSQY